MKKILFLVLALPLLVMGQAFNFTNPFNLNFTEHNNVPEICIKDSQLPLALYYSNYTLSAKRFNGTNFTPEYTITPCYYYNIYTSMMNNDNMSSASIGDTIYISYTNNYNGLSEVFLVSSYNGGVSFNNSISISGFSNNMHFGIPNIKVNNGIINISYVGIKDTLPNSNLNTELFTRVFDINTNQLSPAFNITSLTNKGNPYMSCGASILNIGNETFITFRNIYNDTSNIFLAISNDDGHTFNQAFQIDYSNTTYHYTASHYTPKIFFNNDSLYIITNTIHNNQAATEIIAVNTQNYNSSQFTRNIFHTDLDTQGDSCIFVGCSFFGNSIAKSKLMFSENGFRGPYTTTYLTDTTDNLISSCPTIDIKDNVLHITYMGNDSRMYISSNQSATTVNNIYNKSKSLIKVIDILGQETTPKSNTPLFYLYDDGTVEKKIIIE
jgi:hypothetical protein